MAARKLNDPHKFFILQRLAWFDTPHEVVKAIRQQFDVELTPQTVDYYNPTTAGGARNERVRKPN